jgi:hypothetical protein
MDVYREFLEWTVGVDCFWVKQSYGSFDFYGGNPVFLAEDALGVAEEFAPRVP